jgi:hypothetical protein
MRDFLASFRSGDNSLKPKWRIVITALMILAALGIYFIISLHPYSRPAEVIMPAWVPFWPVFTLPYLGMLVVAAVLPATIRDPARFCACLLGIIIAFLLVLPAWIFLPTELHRPPMPEGWWAAPYRWLATIDPPRCAMPCAHGIGATVGAWFVARERPASRGALVVMLTVGISSIALVGQHRPIDILLGTLAAVVGIIVGETLNSRRA